MTNVKNNHVSPLMVGNVLIPVGATVPVPEWEAVSATGPVKAFLAAGVIAADGETPSPQLPPLPITPTPLPVSPQLPASNAAEVAEDAEKDRIIAELSTLGIEKTKRTSLANLQLALTEAKAGDAPPAPAGLPGVNGA